MSAGTRTGRVACAPFPIAALWREADARYAEYVARPTPTLSGELHGIAVALSIITCDTLEVIAKKLQERYVQVAE